MESTPGCAKDMKGTSRRCGDYLQGHLWLCTACSPATTPQQTYCGRQMSPSTPLFCGGTYAGQPVGPCQPCATAYIRAVQGLAVEPAGLSTAPETHLAACHRRRANYITYMRDRIEDEDWHGVSDAANDLRELDAEIRTLEGASRSGIDCK